MEILERLNEKNLIKIKEILKNKGLVAFPTETVYGLGANAFDEIACRKIYEAKGRPSDNPLIVHIANKKQLLRVVGKINDLEVKLIHKFWPGPLTIIFKKSDEIPYKTTGGLDTVAVRMPSNEFALKLIENTYPLAAPSANTSGKPSPTSAKHVIDDLGDKVDVIIDGGNVDIGIESTIVEVVGNDILILRPGHITKEMLEEFSDNVYMDDYIETNSKPKAPGMKYKHYSPDADVTLLDLNVEDMISYIKEEKETSIGILVSENLLDIFKKKFPNAKIFSYGSNIDEASSNLYAILRRCDDYKLKKVYSITYKKEGKGIAFMNRLEKSAAFNIVRSLNEKR